MTGSVIGERINFMLGLLYKDIVSSKKFILLTWAIIVVFAVGLAFDTIDMKTGLLFILMFPYIFLLGRFFQVEEKNNTMVLLKTLPVSYAMIVASKYLLCFLTAATSILLFFITSVAIPSVGIRAWSGITVLFIIYLISIGTSYSSIGIYVSIRFGSHVLMPTLMVIYLSAVAILRFILPEITMTKSLVNLLILGVLPIINLILFFLSVKTVQNRNFLSD